MEKFNLKPVSVPEIGKTYTCFDDGKINLSRKYNVMIQKVTPFDEMDDKTISYWKEQTEKSYWLYDKQTDYFVTGVWQSDSWDEGYEETFVRTTDGGWFGIFGYMKCGRLDIDGSLCEQLKKKE